MTAFARECELLLAMTEEVELDGELLAAVRRLRNAAVASDAVNVIFEEAAAEVKSLLVEKIARAA